MIDLKNVEKITLLVIVLIISGCVETEHTRINVEYKQVPINIIDQSIIDYEDVCSIDNQSICDNEEYTTNQGFDISEDTFENEEDVDG